MAEKTPEPLRCPSCGAPAAAGAARCEYCHSALATVSCPFCFELLFAGAAFCPHCGTARSRAEVVEGQTTPCPACRGVMRWIKIGATDLLECEACDGTWLEASSFEKLCADRETQAAVVQYPRGVTPAHAPAGPVRYRPCPRCSKMMNRMNFARLSGTIIDVCRGHGTFLDRGELHQVMQFILDGGMDRVRRHEHDELLEEQLRLQQLGRRPADTGFSTPTSSSGWTVSSFKKFFAALFGSD